MGTLVDCIPNWSIFKLLRIDVLNCLLSIAVFSCETAND